MHSWVDKDIVNGKIVGWGEQCEPQQMFDPPPRWGSFLTPIDRTITAKTP